MAQSKTKKSKTTKIREVSNSKPEPSVDELLKMYREMLLIRRFEEKAGQLYGMGLIGGFATSISDKRRLSQVLPPFRSHRTPL